MAFVKRDAAGQIVAVSREMTDGFDELVPEEDTALQAFLTTVGQRSQLAQSDLEFIRVLDDVISVLLEKNILMFTELPEEAQEKFAERNRLRQLRSGALQILDNEKLI
jgi:hypothetical protein